MLLLGLLPGIEVIGSAADGEEAVRVRRSDELTPDVVLMNLRMPNPATASRGDPPHPPEHPDTQVAVLTSYADDDSCTSPRRP